MNSAAVKVPCQHCQVREAGEKWAGLTTCTYCGVPTCVASWLCACLLPPPPAESVLGMPRAVQVLKSGEVVHVQVPAWQVSMATGVVGGAQQVSREGI